MVPRAEPSHCAARHMAYIPDGATGRAEAMPPGLSLSPFELL